MQRDRQPDAALGPERAAAAAYIAAMTTDLREIARRNDLPTLVYLLDMAKLEAEAGALENDD